MAKAARPETALGPGPLALVIAGIRQLTPRIRTYELRAPDGADLPATSAGAHLTVPVRLPDGSLVSRQYSLAAHPDRRDRYEIAVLQEDDGRGGSAAIHEFWQIGQQINLEAPRNQFHLHADSRHAVLIAGGIGITPIKAMAHALKARGGSFDIHYTARSATEMAYRGDLVTEFPSQLHLYFSRAETAGARRLHIPAILRAAPHDAVFYVCGPARLIASVRSEAEAQGIALERVQFESFE